MRNTSTPIGSGSRCNRACCSMPMYGSIGGASWNGSSTRCTARWGGCDMSVLAALHFGGGARTPQLLQTEAAECGLACLALVAGFNGHAVGLATLRSRHPISAMGAGLAQLMEVAAQLQLAARPVRLELHALARLNCPAILHWDMNHFVVLVELRKSGAVIHDPARGRCRMTHAELSRHFTGVALEITPTHEFAPRVERRRISLRALLGRPRGARRTITEVLLLALVLEVFGIVSPWFMQLVVDHALVSEDRNLIVVLATGFLMLALIQVAVTALRGWVLMVFSTQTHLQLVSNLFREAPPRRRGVALRIVECDTAHAHRQLHRGSGGRSHGDRDLGDDVHL